MRALERRAAGSLAVTLLAAALGACGGAPAPSLERGTPGVLVSHARDGVRVREVAPGSGAERAGVRPGDELVAIDGREVRGLGPREVQRALHGAKGSRVRLSLRRPGAATGSAAIEVEVERSELK